MAIITNFKNAFKKTVKQKVMGLARFMNSEATFSQFGEDIYEAEIVQSCIDSIATEFSKLKPRHIKTNAKGEQKIPASTFNRLFKCKPNPLMTTRDFLEKCIWTLYLNYNLFIYPIYEIYRDTNGIPRKRYKGFYPLDPHQVVFEQDAKAEMYIHFYFRNGHDFVLKYSDVVHIRKKYSVNEIMGGGENGQPDNGALLKILEADSIVTEGIGKAVKTSLSVKGILKLNTILNNADMETERTRFEELLDSGDTSILPVDMKSEFTPIAVDPKIVDKDTMEMIDAKGRRWFGVSQHILSGDFTDEQYQAFYEKVLEPLVIGFAQAFTSRVFSLREQDFGNEIILYQMDMNYLSTKYKLDIIKITGEQGLLTNDQKLKLLGYPPLGGTEGAMRTQSLNYIDTKLVSQYQVNKKEEKTDGESTEKEDGESNEG